MSINDSLHNANNYLYYSSPLKNHEKLSYPPLAIHAKY